MSDTTYASPLIAIQVCEPSGCPSVIPESTRLAPQLEVVRDYQATALPIALISTSHASSLGVGVALVCMRKAHCCGLCYCLQTTCNSLLYWTRIILGVGACGAKYNPDLIITHDATFAAVASAVSNRRQQSRVYCT